MRLLLAVFVTLVATNEAFFTDDVKNLLTTGAQSLVDSALKKLLEVVTPTLVGALGASKRDVDDLEDLALLDDLTKTTDQKTEMVSFWKKLQEARKAGTVKEFLAKYAKEQREKMMSKLTPEMKQKMEEHKKRIEAYRAKVAGCQAAVKTAKEAAAKTADKTDGSRRDLFKVYMECMKKDQTKTEEKTAEKQEDLSVLKEKLEKFRAAFQEAKKNGKLQEFLKTHHETMLKQLKEQREKMIAGMSPEMKTRLEAHKQRLTNMKTKIEACRTKSAAMKDASRMEQARSFVKCLAEKPAEKKEEKQEDMKRPRFPKMTPEQKAEFQKKLEEAKKAGTLKEFWENFRKEQAAKKEAARKAYETKKADCMKKVEEAKKNAADADKFDARMEMRNCMMTEEQKKMMEMKKQCAEKVKAAKVEAEKQKQQFSRMDAMKVFRECMKPEEKKTEEKQEDWRGMTDAEREAFMKKFEEAKKAGKVKEFMENFRKEQMAKKEAARKAYEAKKAECMKKVEEAKKNLKDGEKMNARKIMGECMMTEEQKKMMEKKQKCVAAVKAAKETAMKEKKRFGHMEAMKTYKKCMTAEEKTEEKQEDFSMKYMTAEEKAEFRQKVEEAKKAGNLKEFMTNFRKEYETKIAAKKAECEKKVKEMKANVQDGEDFNARKAMKRCMRPPRPTTTAGPTTMPSRSTEDMMTTPEMMTTEDMMMTTMV